MKDEIFVMLLASGLALYLAWGLKALPKERWQMLASVPREKEETGLWRGMNLTYYGFLIACSYTVSLVVVFILLGSLGIGLPLIASVVIVMLLLCLPASGIIARMVEKKKATLTVGGASFVGILAAPWAVLCANTVVGNVMGVTAHVLPVLGAFAIAYSLGEGMGRLACVSFGCCYGKPLSMTSPWMRKVFARHCFVFSGKTKKIAYAAQQDGEQVIPVQGITAVLFIAAGLAGLYIFLKGYFTAAFLGPLITTQAWRVFSEFLRADYRGTGTLSAYQVMSILSLPYSIFISLAFSLSGSQTPDILTGVASLWNPGLILFFELVWAIVFLYTGRSTVTGSRMSFHVITDRI